MLVLKELKEEENHKGKAKVSRIPQKDSQLIICLHQVGLLTGLD